MCDGTENAYVFCRGNIQPTDMCDGTENAYVFCRGNIQPTDMCDGTENAYVFCRGNIQPTEILQDEEQPGAPAARLAEGDPGHGLLWQPRLHLAGHWSVHGYDRCQHYRFRVGNHAFRAPSRFPDKTSRFFAYFALIVQCVCLYYFVCFASSEYTASSARAPTFRLG